MTTKPSPSIDPFAPPKHRLSVLRDQPLSVSRIRNYARCPASFDFTYVRRLAREPDTLTEFEIEMGISSKLGTVCHAAIESVYNEAIKVKSKPGKVAESVATEHYRAAWAEHDLKDENAYGLGLEMVRSYFERNAVNASNVIGVELKFLLPLDGFQITGFIDLLEKTDDGVYTVTDHKSGKWLFGHDDLKTDIQLGVYGWAVRQMFPDAKEVRLQFEMLRHNCVQTAHRTADQCEEAARYLVAMAKQIETKKQFPAVLGLLCSWCGMRQHCDTYKRAHWPEFTDELIGLAASDDMDALGDARATAYGIFKVAEKRYKNLDSLIVGQLKKSDSDYVVTESGWKFSMTQRSTRSYSFDKIDAAFKKAGVQIDASKFVTIGKTKLDEYVNGLELASGKKMMLKATIEALAESKPGRRFLNARQGKR